MNRRYKMKILESIEKMNRLMHVYNKRGGNTGFADQAQLQKSFLKETGWFEDQLAKLDGIEELSDGNDDIRLSDC